MKKYILACSVSLVAISMAFELSAQNRYWVAGSSSNWNNPTNWSTASGGAGGASVPTAGNTAFFDGGGSGTCILDVAPTLSGLTISASFAGAIDLPANTSITTTGNVNFAGGTITSGTGALLTINVSGTTTFSGTQFNASLGGTSNRILFNGSVFNGPVDITKSDNNTDTGAGGNTFNNVVTLRHNGTNELRLGDINPDIFNNTLTLVINNTGSIRPARTAAGTQFNGNIVINYNSVGDVLFGANGGSSILADTYTLSTNCAGTGCDDLSLANFTQVGNTPQSITLAGSGNARLTIGPNSVFNASVTFSAEEIAFNSSTFGGTGTFTQTGSTSMGSRGGNSFQAATFNNAGTGDIHLGDNAADAGDTFNGDVVFNNSGGGRIRIGSSNAGNVFHGNLTLNNTSVVDVQNRIQISRYPGSSTTIHGTTLVNNAGEASDIQISYESSSLTTFNGDVIIHNATSSPCDFFWGYEGDVVMNGNLVISNTGTNNTISFSAGNGNITFGNGTISIGAGGFGLGQLRFRNFTQTGTAATNLTLTGTALLQLGPATTFGGNVDMRAPRLLLNGVTVGGTASLEKTGASDDAGTGGNIFTGVTTITNSGSGYLMTGNGSRDQFLSATTFNNTGSHYIYFAHNHNGQTTEFASDLTLNSNQSGGTNAWSFLVGENTNAGLSVGGTLTINNAGSIQSNYRFLNGNGSQAVFNGPVVMNITNSNPATAITMGGNGTSVYHGDIHIDNTGGSAGVTFNAGASASSILNGTISVGTFSSGSLNLYRFTQNGALPQNLTLTNTGTILRVGPNASFEGDVNFISPRLFLNGCTYSGTGNFEKTDSGDDAGAGGNIFTGVTTITNSGSGYLLTGNGSRDQFLSATTFNNTGSHYIYFAHNHSGQTTEFASDLTLNSNQSGGTNAWSYLIGEGANSGLSVGGTLTINNAGPIQSNCRFLNGNDSQAVFNGPVVINITNSNPATAITMGVSGTSVYHGDIHIENTGGSAGVTFNSGASASSILNGTISVGTFSSGSLNLYRFTQNGAFPQNLTLTNTGTSLRVGPNASFEGDVNFISPRLYLNGCTYSGKGNFEKTDSGDDAGSGGNIFTGVTTITNSGSGYLLTGGSSRDQFLSATTFNNTGSNRIYFAYNHNGETTEFASDLTLNANRATSTQNVLYQVCSGANTGLQVNGTLTINNEGSIRNEFSFLEGVGSQATFNGPVLINISNTDPGSLIRMGINGSTTYNGNISISNSGGSGGVTFNLNTSASSVLNGSVSVGSFPGGSLNFYRFKQVGAIPHAITLTGTAILRLGPSSEFEGDVTFASPRLLLDGTTYHGTAYLEKTSVTADDGAGGNIFNATTTLVNSGDARLRTGNVNPDIFNDKLIITNAGASVIQLAYNSAGNEFKGDIELNSTFGGGIWFGELASASSTLAAGRTIGVGGLGVISGDVRLMRFTQVGPTAQTLALTGIATLTLGPASAFGGDINFSAPQLLLNGVTVDGTAILEKTGAGNNSSNGGNIFNGPTTLINSGSGYFYSAQSAPDIFNDDLTLTNTGSNLISIARNVPGNEFNGDIIFNSTLGSTGIYIASQSGSSATLAAGGSLLTGGLGYSSGYLSLRGFTQLGAEPQTLLLTGTALLQLGPEATFNGNVDFRAPRFELNGTAFNGTTYLEKTGASTDNSLGGNTFNGSTTIANSGSGAFRFAWSSLDTFNGDLTLTNTGTSSVRMADNVAGTVFNGNIFVNSTFGEGIFFSESGGGTATLAAGKTISVGSTGFTAGDLRLKRFTQADAATPQTILMTGTSSLVLGPAISFSGNSDFRAPQVLLNGGTFHGSVRIEKTGATNNTGSGNTIFHGPTTIQVSGTGYLRTNGGNTFNGVTTLINSGSNDLLLELTTASVYNNTVTMTNSGSSYIRSAYIGSNTFNGDIIVNSTSGTGIYFCENTAGSAALANGRTISVGGTGFTAGELRIYRFTQIGSTTQNLVLTGTSVLRTGTGTTWNGNFTASSPTVFLDGSTFNGTTNNITKTGSSTDASTGGNTFTGSTTFVNSGSGTLRLANSTTDNFLGHVLFHQQSGTIQPAYNAASTFQGDVTVNGASAITFGANNGGITFTGTADQNIYKTGAASPVFRRLVMNKASGTVTLNTDATVSTSTTFTSGILHTTATNYLNFADNATATGASNLSFVDGPVRKTGNDAFTFPIGSGSFYRPAGISAPSATTHYFTAQYFNTDHGLGSAGDPSFYSVTKCEYWTIDRAPGASNVLVTLSWQEAACVPGYITDPSTVRVARWNGASWVNHGNGGTTGTATEGTLVTAGLVTSFSPFTLASASLANPLPVELTWFKASVTNAGTGLLEWHTESELNNERFEIQRSENGIDFTTIGSVDGAGTSNQEHDYQFEDKDPVWSLVYYRLKQIDFDGQFEYSRIVSLDYTTFETGTSSFAVYPNPANRGDFVRFKTGARTTRQTVTVFNSLNQAVRHYSDAEGFSTEELTPGIYFVRNNSGEIFRLVIK